MSASAVYCMWGDCHWEKGDGGPHFIALKMVFSLFFMHTYTLTKNIECLSSGLLVYLGRTLFIFSPMVFI